MPNAPSKAGSSNRRKNMLALPTSRSVRQACRLSNDQRIGRGCRRTRDAIACSCFDDPLAEWVVTFDSEVKGWVGHREADAPVIATRYMRV